MKGDFSRSTFEPSNHYTTVRLQQGRVQLDADWNEQMDILVYLLRSQARDLLGPYGAPAAGAGFAITPALAGDSLDLQIGAGRYYVDGILVENERDTLFSTQPYWPDAALPETTSAADRWVIYLDVWERHLSGREAPAILEPALDGMDTTTRTQAVWQVKAWPAPAARTEEQPASNVELLRAWQAWRGQETAAGETTGRATLQPRVSATGYGLTNQLYRVEVHSAGDEVTFKWSRDNGSFTLAVAGLDLSDDRKVLLATLEGLPDELQVQAGDWLELADASFELNGRLALLWQAEGPPDRHPASPVVRLLPAAPLDEAATQAVLAIGQRLASPGPGQDGWPRPVLRRWDHNVHARGVSAGRDGAIAVEHARWLPLENGIEIWFENTGMLRPGDYWLIPARSGSEGYTLLWPAAPPPAAAAGNSEQDDKPPPASTVTGEVAYAALPPRQVDHHLAPLAVLSYDGSAWAAADHRTLLQTLSAFEAEQAVANRRVQRSIEDLQADLDRQVAAALATIASLRNEMFLEVARAPSVVYPVADAAAGLEPNQVVAFDPATGGIQLATRDNAPLVAGVTIGPVGDAEGQASYRVAQAGRHVCLVQGRVEAGDLLVPSSTPGCATAAGLYIQPGTVVGKALEAHHPADSRHCAPIAILVTLR